MAEKSEKLIIVNECGGLRGEECDRCKHRFICWTENPEVITYKVAFYALVDSLKKVTGVELTMDKHHVLYGD